MLQDQLQLAEVLDHGDDRAAELGGEDHGLDVAVVLEAVADDQALGFAFGHRHHGEQLRLRADLEAEAELAAVAVDFLDDQALLVDLDREHRAVAVLVVVLGDRGRERVVQTRQPVTQDVGEAHDDRRRQVARLETADDFVQVDLVLGRLVGPHDDVTRSVDAEVAVAPGLDAIELERILDAPAGAGVRRLRAVLSNSGGLPAEAEKEARTITEAAAVVDDACGSAQVGPSRPVARGSRIHSLQQPG